MERFESIFVKGTRRGELLRVLAVGEQIQLRIAADEENRVLETGSGFRLQPADGQVLELDSRPYRGVIEVFVNPVGDPVAVNELEIEEYLRGVVPGELGPRKYPLLEAQKAQAVAARTFAFKHLGGNARFGFDLFRDQRSQVYEGVGSEEPLSDRGIQETKGIVATYKGDLIWSLYSSTCGGRTEAFHEIFKGPPIEYLMGGAVCHDENSPYYTWEEKIDIRKIQPKLDKYVSVGPLRQVEPLRRSAAGRVVEMLFKGQEKEKILKGNDIRFALGLKSNFLTAMKPISDPSGDIRELVVRGKGWGHGVGMCQLGAVNLAAKGKSYEFILKHYYNGVDLTTYE
ncbi:MAG: SpoIID/LytB domain-containing protein [bacterium]